MTKKFDLEDRLIKFACTVLIFTSEIRKNDAGNYYSHQLLRSSGSSSLNFAESLGSLTVKDCIHKLGLSLKELKQSRNNLRILHHVSYGDDGTRLELLNEVEQLIKIIATIIQNKRKRSAKISLTS